MTLTISKPQPTEPSPEENVPPLENGDRLTRIEFERRYSAMPHLKKAELIEGVVYMPSPVQHKRHGRPHALASLWLGIYWEATVGVDVGNESSLRLDMDNEPQPDVFMMLLPEYGGQASISEDDYVEGAPELVLEVASSSANIDLHRKLDVYRRQGVIEYIVWRVRDRAIDWFVSHVGNYERLTADVAGLLRSEVFPGLVLDATAMISGDRKRVVAVQREALNSPEHAAFVEKLAKTGAKAE